MSMFDDNVYKLKAILAWLDKPATCGDALIIALATAFVFAMVSGIVDSIGPLR